MKLYDSFNREFTCGTDHYSVMQYYDSVEPGEKVFMEDLLKIEGVTHQTVCELIWLKLLRRKFSGEFTEMHLEYRQPTDNILYGYQTPTVGVSPCEIVCGVVIPGDARPTNFSPYEKNVYKALHYRSRYLGGEAVTIQDKHLGYVSSVSSENLLKEVLFQLERKGLIEDVDYKDRMVSVGVVYDISAVEACVYKFKRS